MPFRVVETQSGQRRWSVDQDDDGFRTYACTFRVQWFPETGTGLDYSGPNAALNAEGLPAFGQSWDLPDDLPDAVAYRRLRTRATPVIEDGERTDVFDVELTFSSKPDAGRCKATPQDDPLAVPPDVSITFTRFTEAGTFDRFGQPIQYSSHETILGPVNEWDAGRMLIKITVNVSTADYFLLARAQDTVNDAALWGFPARTLKFSCPQAQQLYYGTDCGRYVRLTYEIEVAPGGGAWDRRVRDQGRRVLRGHWHPKVDVWVLDRMPGACGGVGELPNPFNPTHFMAATDRAGNATTLVLDGAGRPYQPDPFSYTFQGTEAQAKAEADSVHAAYLGPYASEAAAAAVCCTHGAGTGTTPRLSSEQPRQVYVYVGLEPSIILGDPVEDSRNWVILEDAVSPVDHWSDGVYYSRGSLAFLSPSNFIAAAANENQVPGADGTEDTWVELSLGLNDKGTWDENTIYRVGDYVVLGLPAGAPATGTGTGDSGDWWCISGVGDAGPGVRVIERYGESHFQSLPGLPTEL